MILIYKTYSADRANLDHIAARESLIRDLLDRGLVYRVDMDNLARGVVLYDPDKWSDLQEAVNASNDEFDELEDGEDEDDEDETYEADANYVTDVTVTDPDSKLEVTLAVFKDTSTGGMFAIDASFLEQNDDVHSIHSPFYEDKILNLKGLE